MLNYFKNIKFLVISVRQFFSKKTIDLRNWNIFKLKNIVVSRHFAFCISKAVICLEFGIAFLQAYVFVILTCIYYSLSFSKNRAFKSRKSNFGG
jgi:F0F1-type ATP synthase membrane subunit a